MTRQEIVAVLQANTGQRVQVTFGDGVVETVIIDFVDDEGFLHSGKDGDSSRRYWTEFEGVALAEPEPSKWGTLGIADGPELRH
jgi:hypothetical protein